MKSWIDNFTFNTMKTSELLKYVDGFFVMCGIHNLRLSATKYVFRTKILKGPGRRIDENGFQQEQEIMEALQTMKALVIVSNLRKFVHCFR